MLKKIKLFNYRCFNETEIIFKKLTIAVGKNNAGKSTLIEALRIVSVVVNRCQYIHYTSPPDWLLLEGDMVGINPSIDNLEISTRNIFYMYGEPPAKIEAIFDNGCYTHIYIGENAEVFATIFNKTGINVGSKGFAASLKLKSINILPQISPLLREEPIVKLATVQRNLSTALSSRNFRNQLKYYKEDFDEFKTLAEKTWKNLFVEDLMEVEGFINLFIRDNHFDAEIGWMGHGLQMWLQTMWFLARSESNSTVILDEPDVYMHADLQRRLIRIVKDRYRQIIIATHSIEIMSEVEAEHIMPIE